ncbi:MAG: hypothetical protein U0228_16635 [Myxococcaceae bacterium]
MLRRVVMVGLGALALAGCRGVLANGSFTHDGLSYRVVQPPGPEWRRVDFEDNDLAWISGNTGHMIAINATCTGHEDPPLDVLTNHLVIGFTDKELISRTPFKLDGRDALRSIIHAKIDGVPTSLELVVLKKNGCVHDFTYVSPIGNEDRYRKEFEAMVEGFKQERAP